MAVETAAVETVVTEEAAEVGVAAESGVDCNSEVGHPTQSVNPPHLREKAVLASCSAQLITHIHPSTTLTSTHPHPSPPTHLPLARHHHRVASIRHDWRISRGVGHPADQVVIDSTCEITALGREGKVDH